MRTCKHCGKEQADERFLRPQGLICKVCDRERQRIGRYRRLGVAVKPPPPNHYAAVQNLFKTHGPLTRDELMTLAKIDTVQLNYVFYRLRKRGLLATFDDKPNQVYCLVGQSLDAQISQAAKAAVIAANRVAYRESDCKADPEHERWLLAVRARRQEKQQRMECRV